MMLKVFTMNCSYEIEVRAVWWMLWQRYAVYVTRCSGWTGVKTKRFTKPYKSVRIAKQRARLFARLAHDGVRLEVGE